MYKDKLIQLLEKDIYIMNILIILNLVNKDFWLGGGAIRSFVWDNIHGLDKKYGQDYDIVYHNNCENKLTKDLEYFNLLKYIDPYINWQVHNQLRYNNYKDIYEACNSWFDKSTCIMVRLVDNNIEIYAPNGVKILFDCILVPNISKDAYKSLVDKKGWLDRYNKLKFNLI